MTVSQALNFDLISPTAIVAIYTRQFSDIPYAREIAQKVDAQTVFEQYRGNSLPKISGPHNEASYKAINYLIAKFGYRQIIELASGFVPRGMVMTENPNITFIESDLPDFISLKKQLVTQLTGERPNLQFEAIDATSIPSQFPIHADYLRDDERVTILCEGLLLYLTFPEKEQVCANIRELLRHYGGVWITTDIITKEIFQNVLENIPAIQDNMQVISDTTGRSYTDNSFNDIEHARQFFAEQGFSIKEYKLIEIMGELTCLEPLGIDSDFAKRLLSLHSVFALTLKP